MDFSPITFFQISLQLLNTVILIGIIIIIILLIILLIKLIKKHS